jgi:hypothetical protein
MKDFFANMNFPRAVLVVSLVASAVLGYLLWDYSGRLTEATARKGRIKGHIRGIQEKALLLDSLQDTATGDQMLGAENNLEMYIRSACTNEAIGLGQVDTIPRTSPYTREIEDRKIRIRPANKNARYRRGQIGNFLYTLESDSPRIKVTSFKITPADKTQPGEIGNDFWTFEAEITSRQSVSGG